MAVAVTDRSVAAIAAWWVDCLQLLEFESDNGLQFLLQPRALETGREIVEPAPVLVLQLDERGDRRHPAPGPRHWVSHLRRERGWLSQRRRPGVAPGSAGGHRSDAETRSGHLLLRES